MNNEYYQNEIYEAHIRMEDMHQRHNYEMNKLHKMLHDSEMSNQLAIVEIAKLTQENFQLIQIIQQLLNNH